MAGYNLYREGSSSGPVYVTGSSFTDSGLTPSTEYCYSISPVDRSGNELKAFSEGRMDCAYTDSADTAQATFDMSASRISGSDIIVSWAVSGNTSGISGYRVDRNGAALGVLEPSATSYTDSTAEPGIRYCYTVTAVDVSQNELGHGEFCAAKEDREAPSVPLNIGTSVNSWSGIDLSWSASTDNTGVTGYRVYRNGSLVATVKDTLYQDTALSAPGTYCYQVSAVDAAGNESGKTSESCATTLSAVITVRKLNDTGITMWGNETDNSLTVAQSEYPGQDADYGRDRTDNDDSDGHAGFSYTKIGANGETLPVVAANWSAVLDNVTGLMWENKTDDGGLHDVDNTYTWYNPDSSSNGGDAGTQGGGSCPEGNCDTWHFVQAVNVERLCGYSDWRMPTHKELIEIVLFDISSPLIDRRFFSNIRFYRCYWSSSPYALDGADASCIDFDKGFTFNTYKYNSNNVVRLVRGSQ